MWEVLKAFLTNVSILLVWLILATAAAAQQILYCRVKASWLRAMQKEYKQFGQKNKKV